MTKDLDLKTKRGEFKLNTPVALFFYNRPDLLRTILNQIEGIHIPKLYLISDGPNSNRFEDEKKVRECRRLCENLLNVGETIEIYRNFNVGMYENITEGIQKVFSSTETCIFLEDDTLPDITFFRYCQELLELYRENDKVWLIHGVNAFTSKKSIDCGLDSFLFSRYPGFWGWASWGDKWSKYYDRELASYSSIRDLPSFKSSFRKRREYFYWTEKLDAVVATKSTWDTQAIYVSFHNKLLSIVPSVNLVTNIGFNRADATHTTGNSRLACVATESLKFPLKTPPVVSINLEYDKAISNYVAPNFFKRLKISLGRSFRRIRVNSNHQKDRT